MASVVSPAHVIAGILSTVPANSTLTWYPCPNRSTFQCARLLVPVNYSPEPDRFLTSSMLVKLPSLISPSDPSWQGFIRLKMVPENDDRGIIDKYSEIQDVFENAEAFQNSTGGAYTVVGIQHTYKVFDEDIDPDTQLVNLRKPLPDFKKGWNEVDPDQFWFPNLDSFADHSYELRRRPNKVDNHRWRAGGPIFPRSYTISLPPPWKAVEYSDRDWHCSCPSHKNMTKESLACFQWYSNPSPLDYLYWLRSVCPRRYVDELIFCECEHMKRIDFGHRQKVSVCTYKDEGVVGIREDWPSLTPPEDLLWERSRTGPPYLLLPKRSLKNDLASLEYYRSTSSETQSDISSNA
ncbi:hypothetical protein BJ508DRAFT_307700 [Ascobolus immersus RN42]|uniref:Uncharacterized protein n=1 Tax=Ascobolus immersus RN42 TaxID=1160509 RepID=A0A3N4IEK3_ASCIM|nr:hypothetical protein BJ508DRAFT_307700 [Ascobolus immersus RN42]